MDIFYIYVFIYLALGFLTFRWIKKQGLDFGNIMLLIAFVLATGWLFVFIGAIFGN